MQINDAIFDLGQGDARQSPFLTSFELAIAMQQREYF
jgi:hypothetical protein